MLILYNLYSYKEGLKALCDFVQQKYTIYFLEDFDFFLYHLGSYYYKGYHGSGSRAEPSRLLGP